MNKRFPLYWELPASHLFKNETWDYAIYRTLRRELGNGRKIGLQKNIRI